MDNPWINTTHGINKIGVDYSISSNDRMHLIREVLQAGLTKDQLVWFLKRYAINKVFNYENSTESLLVDYLVDWINCQNLLEYTSFLHLTKLHILDFKTAKTLMYSKDIYNFPSQEEVMQVFGCKILSPTLVKLLKIEKEKEEESKALDNLSKKIKKKLSKKTFIALPKYEDYEENRDIYYDKLATILDYAYAYGMQPKKDKDGVYNG